MAQLTLEDIIAELRARASADAVAGMARYGISSVGTLGVSVPVLRQLARRVGRDQALAEDLWATGIHEARVLASMVADPSATPEALAAAWLTDVDSWDVCDQACGNLFVLMPNPVERALRWTGATDLWTRRAGFALIAEIAAHSRALSDVDADRLFSAIVEAAGDDRNYVKKAVNWALRNLGKRSLALNERAVVVAETLRAGPTRSARWIGSDAVRELTSPAVQARIKRRVAPASAPRPSQSTEGVER